MCKLFFFAFVTVAAAASVIHDGTCPDIKPVENFNVSAYQGVWYEISKYDTANEQGGKCAQAEYKLEGDVVKLKNTHIVNGVQTSIEGTAKLADDAKNSAKLLVTLNFGEFSRETPLQVVATDYKSYAIAYNCKNDDNKKNHQDTLWVLSRTKTLEGDAKTAVDTFFKNNKDLDATKLVQTDFSEEACKFTSTAVVTEHKD
ncbi:unnamed protein product [Diatraea saccharalis]|uniref:Lipocalin/cytosolic fatty-acid binding domain-containing protein n=1 Tax=Diatraea saccharalis TaxID=40085 RepID=A0A9N9WEB3_9NEOP|nr:unnamed protein product [Diatraea saccharalis]